MPTLKNETEALAQKTSAEMHFSFL